MAQIGLSLVLLVGSSLLLRSFLKLVDTDPGFRPEHILTVWIPGADATGHDTAPLIRRYSEIIRRTEGLPGVSAVGLASTIPMGSFDVTTPLCLPGDKIKRQVRCGGPA
jgi:putative ABC transport system permease protein